MIRSPVCFKKRADQYQFGPVFWIEFDVSWNSPARRLIVPVAGLDLTCPRQNQLGRAHENIAANVEDRVCNTPWLAKR